MWIQDETWGLPKNSDSGDGLEYDFVSLRYVLHNQDQGLDKVVHLDELKRIALRFLCKIRTK